MLARTTLISLVITLIHTAPWTRKIVIVTDGSGSTEDVLQARDWSSLLSSLYEIDSSDIEVFSTGYQMNILQAFCSKYESSSIAVVDTTQECHFADIASGLFDVYIRVTHNQCQGREVIYIRPSLTTYADAVFDFTDRAKTLVTKSVFLYDEIFGPLALSEMMYERQPHVLTRKMTSQDSDFTTWLGQLATRQTVHFIVVVGGRDSINSLFEKICSITIPDTFHWTVVLTDDFHFNWTLCSITHLVVLRHQLDWSKTAATGLSHNVSTAFLLDGISLAMMLLNSADETSLHICDEKKYDTREEKHYKMVGVTSTFSNGKPSSPLLQIIEIKQPNLRPQLVGTWQYGNGIFLYNLTFSSETKYKISVVTKHEPPFVIRNEGENGTTYSGYAIDVFDEIARRLNMEYELYEPADGQYGKHREDGTSWSGLMGEILTGYADIAVASLSMTTERDTVVDFTTPYYEFGGIQILIRNSNPSTTILAFTTVFSSEVWMGWAAVLLLSGILVYIFERFSPYSPYKDAKKNYVKRFTLKESLWMVIASFTMSGPECSPVTTSSRMMTGGFWFFSSIMMATYTANLAAFLTNSRLSMPIESLDDLARQSSIKYSVVEGTSIHDYFERMANIESNLYQIWKEMSYKVNESGSESTISPSNYAVWDYPLGDKYMTVWKSIRKTGLVNDTNEGIQRVLNENFAFIHESPMIQYELSRHCDLMAVGKQFSSRPYAFALPQGSPLTNLISYTILELQSEPILEKLKTKWWKTESTSCSVVDESRGLTFHTVGGIFLLVIAGIILGVISLVAEHGWAQFTSSIPMVRHNVDITSPNSRTNLASEFNSGFTYLARSSTTETELSSQEVSTLEMAQMY